MSIKRYEWVACDEHSCHCDVVESAEGDMVDYEDYAALEQRLIESERYGRQTDITIDNLELKLAQMAAELSAVEAIHNEAVFITDDHYEQCPPEVQKMIRSLAVLQIPAYQAFLAEVRAQGVEMFAAWNDKHIKNGVEHKESLTAVSHAARGFSAQLRKGAQS